MAGKPVLRAMLGGLIGSIAWLIIMYALPMTRGVHLHVFQMLSGPAGRMWAIIGLVVFGIVLLPLFYSKIFFGNVSVRPWLAGLMYGIALWVVRGFILAPIIGHGLFDKDTAHPALASLSALIAFLAYGLIVGLAGGRMSTERTKVPEKMYSELR